ncbi:MAG: cell envelope integrity protein CreD [Desulfomonile tiedjei]|nr:cell envelope integrity protein CreD [Desulfomonile tiedjei]
MENRRGINFLASLKKSPFARILLLGFLVLLLHVPAAMIKDVIRERQSTRHEAVEEVTGKWGRSQIVVGPSITVPFVRKWTEQTKTGETKTRSEIRYATFLPESLHWSGKLDSEVRYRGIFKVPIYRMALTCTGQFARPDLSQWKVASQDILWDRAYLSTRVSDVRAIANKAILNWNDKKMEFLPGAGEASPQNPGIHADLTGLLRADSLKFSFTLNLNGSEKALFAPFGKETRVDLESNWSDPSFQGSWLPSQRTVNQQGFKANWTIPFLGRNYPQKWTSAEPMDKAITASLFGVSLISPVDHYRMAERSTKYMTLFLSLTFITLWLFEVLAKIRIHAVQYLLVGAGMCLFYLLELSLAEHIGFTVAYAIASFAIVALTFSYCIAVLKRASRAIIVGTVVTILYSYLYVLLRDQDYALLVGSAGLFVVLAVIMFMTRKVDWYASQE